MELPEPPLGGARRLAGMEERDVRPLVARLEPERGVDLLDGPLRLREASVGDAGDVPPLLRQRLALIAIDARDLEQGDVVLARVGVAASGVEERGIEDGADRG